MAVLYLVLGLCIVCSLVLMVNAKCNETFNPLNCEVNAFCENDVQEFNYGWQYYSNGNNQKYGSSCVDNPFSEYLIKLFFKNHNNFPTNDVFDNQMNGNVKNIIKSLGLINDNYLDIPIITDMRNLRTIDLSDNFIQIATLDNLKELPSLKEINLSHNKMINILAVKQNNQIHLENINLSYNSLEKVPNDVFDKFNELIVLDLSYNLINILEPLTFEGVKNLVHMNISHNSISDINASLFRFSELETLDFSYNKLNSIVANDFGALTRLITLNLKSNLISSLDSELFFNLRNLQSLDISDNELKVLDKDIFKNIVNLKHVMISNNQLKKLPKNLFKNKSIESFSIAENNLKGAIERGMFEGLLFITEIDLSKQHLESIQDNSFYGLGQLVTLLLQNNEITTLSPKCLNMLTNLEHLDLSSNKIKNIEFQKQSLSRLETFLIRNNYLAIVKQEDFQGLDSLQVLDLSDNRITKLESDSFKSLKNLISFEISNNPLNGALEENTFEGLNSLPSLDISCSLLTVIQNGSFNGMIQLKNLNISRSKIETLQFNSFNGTGSIEILDLSNNKIKEFNVNNTHISNLDALYLNNNLIKILHSETFEQMSSLTVFLVSYNQIENLNSFKFPNDNKLRVLDVSYNPALTFNMYLINNTINLFELNLSGTKNGLNFRELKSVLLSRITISNASIVNITTLKLNGLKNLDTLDLSSNKISNVDFSCFANISNLRNLDLSFNQITNIQPGTFKHNTELQLLNISHNYLTSISYGIFRGLVYLDTLDISYNKLDNLQNEKFDELKRLRFLIADHNRIEDINVNQFRGSSLMKLSIGGNPIPCSLLVEFQRSHMPLTITAIKLDEHNHENIDGITCNRNNYILNKNENATSNVIDNENIRSILLDIRDILHVKLNIDHEITKNDDKEYLTNITNELSKTNHDSQVQLLNLAKLTSQIANRNDTNVLLEKILKVMMKISLQRQTTPAPITKDNATYDNLVNYINNLKQQLEDTIAFEKNNILSEVDIKLSATNKDTATLEPVHEKLSTSTTDSKPIFTEICVALILLILVCLILYKFYKSGLFIRKRFSVSTRELPDAMDSVL